MEDRKMKGILKNILLASVLCLAASCSLKEEPTFFVNKHNFYKTVDQCKASLNACYAPLNNIYVADFEPDYDILPIIAQHFVDRFRVLPFAIRDLKHMRVLIHEGGEDPHTVFAKLEEAEKFVDESDDFEELWKGYYKSMTIKERINPNYKLRQQFMPKKFWNNICELKNEQ